jgi:hypothetical protein
MPVDPVARCDLDHRSGDRRPGTSVSGRPAADSPETATLDGGLGGAGRFRAPGRDLAWDLSPDEQLNAANPTKVPNGTGRRRR